MDRLPAELILEILHECALIDGDILTAFASTSRAIRRVYTSHAQSLERSALYSYAGPYTLSAMALVNIGELGREMEIRRALRTNDGTEWDLKEYVNEMNYALEDMGTAGNYKKARKTHEYMENLGWGLAGVIPPPLVYRSRKELAHLKEAEQSPPGDNKEEDEFDPLALKLETDGRELFTSLLYASLIYYKLGLNTHPRSHTITDFWAQEPFAVPGKELLAGGKGYEKELRANTEMIEERYQHVAVNFIAIAQITFEWNVRRLQESNPLYAILGPITLRDYFLHTLTPKNIYLIFNDGEESNAQTRDWLDAFYEGRETCLRAVEGEERNNWCQDTDEYTMEAVVRYLDEQ